MKKLIIVLTIILCANIAFAMNNLLDNQGKLFNLSTGDAITASYDFNVTYYTDANAEVYTENDTVSVTAGIWNYIQGYETSIAPLDWYNHYDSAEYITATLTIDGQAASKANLTKAPLCMLSDIANDTMHINGTPAFNIIDVNELDNNTIVRTQNTSWITTNQDYNSSQEIWDNVVNNGTFMPIESLMNGSDSNFTNLDLHGKTNIYMQTTEDIDIYNPNGSYRIMTIDNSNTDGIPNARITFYRNGSSYGSVLATTNGMSINTITVFDYLVNGVTRARLDSAGNWNVPWTGNRNVLYQTGDFLTQNMTANGITIDSEKITSWDTFQDDIGSNCSADNYVYGVTDDGTLLCRADATGGSGGANFWIDDGNHVSVNSTRGQIVNATTFTSDWLTNITGGDVYAANFYDNGVLLTDTTIDNCSVDQSCGTVIYHTDKLGNDTTEIRSVFFSSDNISIDSGTISINKSFTDWDTDSTDDLVDSDFGSAGLMKTDGAGTYSVINDDTSTYLANQTAANLTELYFNGFKMYVDDGGNFIIEGT